MNLSLTKLELKYKLTLFTLMLIVLNIIFYFFIYSPQREEICTLNNQLELQQQQIKVVEDFISKHPDITAYDSELNSKLDKINKMIPENPDVSLFIDEISKLAIQSSIQINNITPGELVDKNNYREFKIVLKISGDYFDLLKFLQALNGLDRLTSVSTIQTSAKGNIVESDLALVVYCYGSSKDPAGEKAKATKSSASKTN